MEEKVSLDTIGQGGADRQTTRPPRLSLEDGMIVEHIFICADCKKPFKWVGDNPRHIPKRCGKCQAKRRAMLQGLRRRGLISPRRVAGMYDITAKCPKCGRDHVIQMTAIPDVKPRVYCPDHERLRNHREFDAYEVGRI